MKKKERVPVIFIAFAFWPSTPQPLFLGSCAGNDGKRNDPAIRAAIRPIVLLTAHSSGAPRSLIALSRRETGRLRLHGICREGLR